MGDLNINYANTGIPGGRSVVLLHGWGTNMNTFAPIAKELEKNFNVHNLDFPGFGDSSPPESVWGVEEYTDFLERFVNEKQIKNPIIIAHSFGGRVSLLYSSRNHVNKLIIIDGAGIKPKRPLKYYIKVYSYKLTKKLLPLFIGKENAEKRVELKRKKSGSSDYNNASGIMRDILVKVVNEDLKHVLPNIEAPTLLIWGENDTATPVRDAKIMEKNIPDCGLVILKNAGHFSFLDKPYEVNTIIDSFLEKDKVTEWKK